MDLFKENMQNVVLYDRVTSKKAYRIGIIGKTGSGKSSTGNTILEEKRFAEDICPDSVTKCCESFTAQRFGITIQIVDTPGFLDTSLSLQEAIKEIARCVVMLSPGPHVFLLVMRPDRFTEEEQNTVTHLLDLFGRDALSHIIIVFTRKDELDRNRKTLQQFINANQKLKEITDMCPVFAIDNTKDTNIQSRDLIALIEHTINKNDNNHYTIERLQSANEEFELKKKEKEEKEQRKYKEIVTQMREKFEKEQTNLEKELSELKNEYDDLLEQVESGQKEFQQVLSQKNQQMEELRKDMENANTVYENRLKELEAEKIHAINELQLEYEKKYSAKVEKLYAQLLESVRDANDKPTSVTIVNM